MASARSRKPKKVWYKIEPIPELRSLLRCGWFSFPALLTARDGCFCAGAVGMAPPCAQRSVPGSLPCQVRVYPMGTARRPLLHDILGQAAGLRQMVLVPGRDDTAFAHLLVRAML